MIKAYTLNFGQNLYTGESLQEAIEAIEWAGFEGGITEDGEVVAVFSPITGWKMYV